MILAVPLLQGEPDMPVDGEYQQGEGELLLSNTVDYEFGMVSLLVSA